jgi:hypothetical protein
VEGWIWWSPHRRNGSGDFGHLGVVQHVAAMTSSVGCRAPLRGGVGGLLGEVAMRPRPA